METVTQKKSAEGLQKSAINLSNLKHALKITALAGGKASTLPILQCVRMQQIASGLALEATDLDLYVRVVLPELGGPETPIVTPSEKFTAWAKLLTGEDVHISATDARATVTCGRAKAQLPLLPVGNWPSNEVCDLKADSVTLTQGSFARALRFALISMSEEASRYTLCGVKLCGNGSNLDVVSTEGHTLMLYTIPCEEKIDLLLPGYMVKALLPLLTDEDGGIDLAFEENQILATIDAEFKTYVASRRIAGQFPNWRAVFPNDKRTDVKVKVADLAASLERCALLSDEKSNAIDLTFSTGEIAVHAADAQHGVADETVSSEGTLDSPLKIRINGDFLRSLLRRIDGDVVVALPGSNDKPLLFKSAPHEGETLGYVVMPMRG